MCNTKENVDRPSNLDHRESWPHLLLALGLPSAHVLPNPIKHLHQLRVERTSLKDDKVLVELSLRRCPNDQGIAEFSRELRVIRRPPERSSVPRDAMLLRVHLDDLGGGEERVVEVVTRILGTEGTLDVPAAVPVVLAGAADLVGEEATGRGRVGVEGDVVFAEDGEELGLGATADRVVLALVDGGFDEAVCFAEGHDLLDFLDGVVA